MFGFKKIYDTNNNEISLFSHKNYAIKAVSFIILLYFGTSILLSLLEYTFPLGNYQKIFEIYTQGLWQILFLFLPTVYFAKKSSLPTKELLRLGKTPPISIIILAILGILIFQVFSSSYLTIQKFLIPNSMIDFYNSLEKNMEEVYNKILGGNGTFPFIRALLIGAIIPAFSEETLFRGFFQKSLEKELTVYKAIVYSSLIFTFIHFNPISFIPLFVIGLYLGIIAFATDNILLPIILHFINNAIAVVFLFSQPLTQLEDKVSDIPFVSIIVIFLLSLSLIVGILYNIIRFMKNKYSIIF